MAEPAEYHGKYVDFCCVRSDTVEVSAVVGRQTGTGQLPRVRSGSCRQFGEDVAVGWRPIQLAACVRGAHALVEGERVG